MYGQSLLYHLMTLWTTIIRWLKLTKARFLGRFLQLPAEALHTHQSKVLSGEYSPEFLWGVCGPNLETPDHTLFHTCVKIDTPLYTPYIVQDSNIWSQLTRNAFHLHMHLRWATNLPVVMLKKNLFSANKLPNAKPWWTIFWSILDQKCSKANWKPLILPHIPIYHMKGSNFLG